MSVSWPLRVASTGRYLEDQAGVPFLLKGDSPWALVAGWSINGTNGSVNGTTAPSAAEVDTYLDDRQSRGFNTIAISPVYWDNDKTLMGPNPNGDRPFLSVNDFAKPNEAFFVYLDAVIAKCLARDILVILFPAWAGFPSTPKDMYANVMTTQVTKMRGYGRYISARYRTKRNVMLALWGDHNVGNREVYNQMAAGILQMQDPRAPFITTAEVQRGNASVDGVGVYEAWHKFTWCYTTGDQVVYQQVRTQYQAAHVCPLALGETDYEPDVTAREMRTFAYWPLLSGACGYLFGNSPIWYFGTSWQTALSGTGSLDVARAWAVFDAVAWHKLVPDHSHVVAVSGYGTDGTATYATVASIPDGTLVLGYVPNTGIDLVVNMAKLRGLVTASWIDPTNAAVASLGTFAPSGLRTFTHPGLNNAGAGDWILKLVSA